MPKSLLSMTLSLMLTLMPMTALAQTSQTPSTSSRSTTEKTVTLTGEELSEVVDRACAAARKKADLVPDLRLTLSQTQTQRDHLAGQVEMLRDVDALRIEAVRQREQAIAERDSRWSTLTVVVVAIGVGVLGGVGGWAIGNF